MQSNVNREKPFEEELKHLHSWIDGAIDAPFSSMLRLACPKVDGKLPPGVRRNDCEANATLAWNALLQKCEEGTPLRVPELTVGEGAHKLVKDFIKPSVFLLRMNDYLLDLQLFLSAKRSRYPDSDAHGIKIASQHTKVAQFARMV